MAEEDHGWPVLSCCLWLLFMDPLVRKAEGDHGLACGPPVIRDFGLIVHNFVGEAAATVDEDSAAEEFLLELIAPNCLPGSRSGFSG